MFMYVGLFVYFAALLHVFMFVGLCFIMYKLRPADCAVCGCVFTGDIVFY